MKVFVSGDEVKVVELWSKVAEGEKGYGSMTIDTFRKKVIDNPNFDPKGAFLAYSGKTLVGFCLVVIRKEPFKAKSLENFPAFLSAIIVHPSYRRLKIGSRLISEAIEYLRGQGKKEIQVGYNNPIPLFIGIDVKKKGVLDFFTGQGFEEEGIEIIMTLSLSEFEKEKEIKQLQEKVAGLGILVLPLKKQDVHEMLELLREQAVWWWYEPMVKDVESGELNPSNVFVAKENERIVGFVRVDKIGENGDVWGILTHPETRCMGIGTLLLYTALNKLKKDGVKTIGLTTGSKNYPAQRIYGKAGFKKIGAFAMFRKKI